MQETTQPYQDTQPSDQVQEFHSPEKKFPWGCVFGGCLGVVLLIMISIGVLIYAGFSFYQGQIAKYTSEEPQEIPAVQLSEEEIEAVSQRVETFKDAIDDGSADEPLVLTADDINALLASKDLSDNVYVKIEGETLGADVSIPTDFLPGAKGRYFNASVTLSIELRNGRMEVYAEQAEVNGSPVPDEFMQGLRNENLAKEMNKDPETAEVLERFESVSIEDGKLILTPKKPSPAEEGSDAEASDGEAKSDDEGTEKDTAAPTGELAKPDQAEGQPADGQADPTGESPETNDEAPLSLSL